MVTCAFLAPAMVHGATTGEAAARGNPGAAPTSPKTGRGSWSLAEAAKPYRGVTVKVSFLPRPGYQAAIKLIPEFERVTGIRVNWELIYYEDMRKSLVLDFTSGNPRFDVILIDIVWLGEFASAGWVTPLASFFCDPALADPELDLKDFFPLLLNSLGTWDGIVYGLPIDSYAGLLFYNRCRLHEAGFSRPPDTWQELLERYAPALTTGDRFAFALQSHAGETQSCDSFMRFIWPFGGSLLTPAFTPNLSSPGAVAGLKFRQQLLRYMPPDVVDWEHEQAVQALADGKVAMITEWSGWYKWLADSKSSKTSRCLGVTVEPAGPAGRKPALGGFSLGVNAQSSQQKQKAAWLFIQWLTSKKKAREFTLAGGVPGRRSAYLDRRLQKRFPYFEPLVTSWTRYGNPLYRPRFKEWPAISGIIAETGTRMMRGEIGVDKGARQIDDQIYYILYESGYYGNKPKLQ
ncbi:ABC transporter substrate-binding protein [Geomonas anaerohicana]|uniref:Sugar ABC transporter substrate-binding protein n=1 Tax=Geomonas anaerohicana TaxID=2798583 RepID=A0ABS0YIJ8_9BACT|nr:sugar ABC transporter substrate-binding protein [Geomonas anaerohicana]MBJ6752047.1 sugar ABC transporter substrate-binding protein [Geomonas anaerohicana]